MLLLLVEHSKITFLLQDSYPKEGRHLKFYGGLHGVVSRTSVRR